MQKVNLLMYFSILKYQVTNLGPIIKILHVAYFSNIFLLYSDVQ